MGKASPRPKPTHPGKVCLSGQSHPTPPPTISILCVTLPRLKMRHKPSGQVLKQTLKTCIPKINISELFYIQTLQPKILNILRMLQVIAVKQMRRTGNHDETKRIFMDLDVVLKSHDCKVTSNFRHISVNIFISGKEINIFHNTFNLFLCRKLCFAWAVSLLIPMFGYVWN